MNTIESKRISIREMAEADLKFVNSTRNILSTREWLENSGEISYEETLSWFRSKKPKWYIVSANSEPVGYLRTSDNTGKSMCIGCDIHPDHRRKGYAREAYQNFMSYLYKSGYVLLWLEVFNKNLPARSLYESLGFIDIGSRIVNNREYSTMVHRR